ncbi:MAG: adenosylmethionine--8-amino-7-oxononanoate transaminase [Moraxella sp.]|nr:adenosylmethionine--8-amino-7-oxononanoate transaminase [Moraxella sp.]
MMTTTPNHTTSQPTTQQPTAGQSTNFDRTHLWHPYASLPPSYDNLMIERASGVYLYTNDGKSLIDGMSSWWAAIHGYNHPTLNHAIKAQLDKMAHVMFGGLTHAPAQELGELLLSILPKNMHAIFFADSGSVAVEVALKTALQYQIAKSEHAPANTKRHFATTRSGYHGDTWHAMSVCDPVTGMHGLYGTQLPVQYFLPAPPMGFDVPLDDTYRRLLDDFFATHHHLLAGFIIEPIVQGAGGMRFYSPDILKYLDILCKQYDILLIADEIATGFGRTGKMFACQWADVMPDIITLGKGLSGGYMSFACVASSWAVADTIHHSQNPAIMHGPTFMGNPLACAVSITSVQLCIDNNTPAIACTIQTKLSEQLSVAKQLPKIADVRCLGAIGVIEMCEPINMPLWQSLVADFGIWVRPFGKLVYLMPPLIINDDELTQLCQRLIQLLKKYCSII